MHLVVLVPESIKLEFSNLVDSYLSRVLDWNLIYFEDVFLSGDEIRTSCRTLVYLNLECPVPGVIHRGLQELEYGYPLCFDQLNRSSVWLFSLSQLCLVGDVDEVIDQMHKLGCHIGLTSSHPVGCNR